MYHEKHTCKKRKWYFKWMKQKMFYFIHIFQLIKKIAVMINKKTKKTCKIVDFAVPADHRIKLKECEKNDKYLDLARELKKNYGTWRWQLYQLWLVLLVL